MIGNNITGKDGKPLDATKLERSQYQPPQEVKELFARCQADYQTAYMLQHRSFDEFDGISLLDRARLDQETFGAFVGASFVAPAKRWRWRGRKNTARNKIMSILAQMLAGMLYPYVSAKNDNDEDDKMTARVMRILIEDFLKKADYEMKFMYMLLSALVNPAVHVEVEYVEALQTIKQKLSDGTYQIVQAVDEIISGLNLHIIPIDEAMPTDFYTGNIQEQNCWIRLRRITYDKAKKKYQGVNIDANRKDQFDYVQAGMTRVFLAGQERQTLFDIEWTEADRNYVQEATFYYRSEDIEVTFVGGVFMGNEKDVYNSNPFSHRRMTLVRDKWMSIPVIPVAKAGYEPIDPTGRFYYYKSAANKEYWDDAAVNKMYQLVHDGTHLDVIKPIFMSGVAKVDQTVIIPGATVGMPMGASATPYQLGPNIQAAYQALQKNADDLSDSTTTSTPNQPTPGVTAYAIAKAEANARITLGNFGLMIANLVEQIGELTKDVIVMHATIGDLDSNATGQLSMKYKTFLAKGKEKGKTITNRIVFTDKYMGRTLTKQQLSDIRWDLWKKAGGKDSDQVLFMVNPYQAARTEYTLTVDADKITMKSAGLVRQEKLQAFNILTDPRVAPYTDQKAVVDDFAIEEFGGDDPDKYKKKGDPMSSVMPPQMPGQGQPVQQQKPNPALQPAPQAQAF